LNCKRKGSRAELKAIRILEAAGYVCTKAGGSLGLFDVVAVGRLDVRLLQVKSGGAYASAVEREQLELLPVPANCSKEIWRFPNFARTPLVERLSREERP
jgi:Holliday junction resolvase